MQALFGRGKKTKGGSDAKFFSSTSKKGEVGELKAELRNSDVAVVKDAMKKVIAGLTVGKDMSGVFADVTNCIAVDNLEVKKLVYLYLINYAKSKPDLAIMAVNIFVRDSTHHNPLIRALAVRTMGCIRVERITEHLDAPLKKALSDEDPYVRKTAAICVAKLHDVSPPLVRDHGFLTQLQELLNDPNPTVVANAVAALSEIQLSYGSKTVFDIPPTTLQKLLAALNECTEWGQVYILDALAQLYTPSDAREAETVIERVLPRLAHQNTAVVLSAVKIVLLYMEHITGEEALATYRRKLAPPLVTLAQSVQPEIQYVALRNISLVVQKEPFLLTNKIKVFFCKYNDPIYVKMEKLEILVQLVNPRNVDNVLSELKEYATEVDVEYVRRAVRTIGRCAIKLEGAAEKCLKVLLTLIDTKVNYVVQEAIVVIKDIFRKYPNRYEGVISALCDNLDTLDEPEAKASMIWIIGEYAGRIENADDLLDSFVDGFHDEPAAVQLALLTATVKLFLVNPETEDLVQAVLAMAAEESDNPDLRDRGYIYWRLLTSDEEAAKAVVLAEKPVIHDDTNAFGHELLGELIANLSSLASVFHKPPDSFVKRRDAGVFDMEEEEDDDDEEYEEEAAPGAAAAAAAADDGDLLDIMGGSAAAPAPVHVAPPTAPEEDLFGMGGGAPAPALPSALSHPVVVTAEGFTVHAALVFTPSGPSLQIGLENAAPTSVSDVAIAVNKNSLGLTPTLPKASFGSVPTGSSGSIAVPLTVAAARATGLPLSATLDVALRDNTSRKQVIFKVPFALDATFQAGGGVGEAAFPATWASLATGSVENTVRGLPTAAIPAVCAKLQAANVAVVTTRPLDDGMTSVFVSASTLAPASGAEVTVLAEIKFKEGFNGVRLVARGAGEGVSAGAFAALQRIITA